MARWSAGVAIDLLRFPHDAGQAGVVLPQGMLNGLILAWGPGAAVLGVLGMFVLSPYAISRRRHDVIAAELGARRAGLPSGNITGLLNETG